MIREVKEASLNIKLTLQGKLEIKQGTVVEMTEKCCAGHQIYCNAVDDAILVESSRGNKLGWENITSKWSKYAKELESDTLPEDFKKMLEKNKPIANVNDRFESTEKDEEKAVATIVSTDVITDVISDKDKSGDEVLKEAISKNPKHIQEKINILGGYSDSSEANLEKMMNNPVYAAVQNMDGSHTLISKGDIEVRTKALRINESKNIVPHIYLRNIKNGYTSNMVAIPASNVRNGGSKFKNELKNIGGYFSDIEISIAYGKLLVLVMKNMISTVEDESMSYSDILSHFKDYVVNALTIRYDDTKVDYCPSVIVEKKDSGNIVVGIRNTDFDMAYKELIETTLVMSERVFKRQAKMLGDLIPDAGRGGGDHTLGEKYCPRYGMGPGERMQRINYPDDELEALWEREEEFRGLHPDLVVYVTQVKEIKA